MADTIPTGAKPCRDCGTLLAPKQRGCPRCAYNVEAEAMLDRFLWRRLAPGLVIFVLLLTALVFFLRR